MTVFACYNIKGGVGKTAAAVNLAFLAARDGARVLLWDLDPQGAASFYLRVEPAVKGGRKALFGGKRPIDEAVRTTGHAGLDLLPADFSLRNVDLALDGGKKSKSQVRKLIKPLLDTYEHVFIDCAPGISLVSENVFRAADVLLVPTIPTTLSVRTLEQIAAFRDDKDLESVRLLPFFSMSDRRKSLHNEIMRSFGAEWPDMLTTDIPYASEVERMGITREPVCAHAPGSRAALAYERLWREIRERTGG